MEDQNPITRIKDRIKGLNKIKQMDRENRSEARILERVKQVKI